MHHRSLVALGLIVCAVTSGFDLAPTFAAPPADAVKPGLGKPGVLDIVPSNAALALSIRNLQDLKRKGETFLEKTELQVFLRPSQLFDFALSWIGVRKGVDDQAPIALIMVDPDKVGTEYGKWEDLEKTLVLAIPFNDRDQIAANFSLQGTDLKLEKIISVDTTPKGFDLRGYVAVRGRHLLMAAHAPAIQLVLDAKPIRQTLGQKQQQLIDQSDIVLQAGPRNWGEKGRATLQEAAANADVLDESPEAALVRRFSKAIRSFRLGLVGAQIDGGLHINIITLFDDVGEARQLLTELAAGSQASDLRGLPNGNILFAQGLRSDGVQTVTIARKLASLMLGKTVSMKFASVQQHPILVDIIGDVWQRLQGSRFAVYQNQQDPAQGLFNLMAILDTDDAGAFLTEMRELTTFISSAGLQLSNNNREGIDVKTVERLIGQLGHESFRERQSATLKIRLVGEATLPLLERATMSEDFEIATRAKLLRQQIMKVVAARRKKLLDPNLLSRVNPKFAYFPKVETRRDTPIDIVNIRLSQHSVDDQKQLQKLFGPDWSKIRIARHGQQILMLIGSDTRLLDRALQHMQQGTGGLDDHRGLKTFRGRSDADRQAEWHVALAQMLKLIKPAGQPATNAAQPATKPTAALSSLALTIAPTRIQIDLFAPFSEAKSLVKGWIW